jgi:hypothetical protein
MIITNVVPPKSEFGPAHPGTILAEFIPNAFDSRIHQHQPDQRRFRMTTSKETEWMNHPRLRKLVTSINELTLAERITLVKGLVPAIADELSDTEYERFVDAIRLKGERFHEAQAHPGEGKAERKIPGERDLEGR